VIGCARHLASVARTIFSSARKPRGRGGELIVNPTRAAAAGGVLRSGTCPFIWLPPISTVPAFGAIQRPAICAGGSDFCPRGRATSATTCPGRRQVDPAQARWTSFGWPGWWNLPIREPQTGSFHSGSASDWFPCGAATAAQESGDTRQPERRPDGRTSRRRTEAWPAGNMMRGLRVPIALPPRSAYAAQIS